MWIIALVGSLAVIAVFILWIPLDIVLDVDVHGRPKVTVGYSWLFGLVKRARPGRKERPRKKKSAGRLSGISRANIGLALRVLRSRGLLKNIFRMARGVLGSFRLADLGADLRVGLGDPTDTGMLFAVLGPATALLGPAVYGRVNLQPGYDEGPFVEGYSHGAVRLRPIRLVPHVFRFTFSRPTVRSAWMLLAARFKRKR